MEKIFIIKRKWPKKILVSAGLSFLFVSLALITLHSGGEGNPYIESEAEINRIIAKQLNRFPDELTRQDYESIEEIHLSDIRISSLKPLSKLKNLQKLAISSLYHPSKLENVE